MTVDPTDKFLVNRSGSSYNVDQQDLMAQLEDDDLLLVNRNSKSYKITGAEFKGSLSSPPIIQSVTLTEDDPEGARFTSQDFTTTAVMLDNGNPASTKSIRGWVEGQLNSGPIETDELIGTTMSAGYYAPTLTTNGTMPPDEEKKKPFDGTLSVLGIDGDETTWMQWDFGSDFQPKTNGLPYVLKIELRNTGGTTVDVFVNGSDTRVEPDSDNYPDADREFVVSIASFQTLRLMGGANGPNCRRITVDGVVLRDADEDLVFASNKDLDRLKVGDYVTQDNSGGVPSDYSSTMTGADAGTPASRAFDGVTDGDSHRAMGSTLTWDATPYDLAGPVDVWTINSRTVEVVGSNGNQSLSAPAGSTSSKLSFNDLGTVQTIRTTAGSGIIYGIAVNGNLLVDGDTTFIDGTVTQIDVDSDRISVTYDNDPFGPPNEGRYVIGPDAPVDEIKKYLNLDASLNVIGLTDDDSYTRIPGNTLTSKISFPATLDNGEAPDDALPAGTCIQTEVIASNVAGSDTKSSLCITPIESIGPNATMHGLRFENTGPSILSRIDSPSNSKVFSFSCWIKPTSNDAKSIFSTGNTSSDRFWVRREATGEIKIYAQRQATSTAKTDINKWSHISVAIDTTQAVGSERLKLTINGVPQTITGGYPDQNIEIGISKGELVRFGEVSWEENAAGGSVVAYRGYLSDVYFVEGQALEPETFGDFFEGKWGPLDSSVVKTNIGDFGANGFYLPFDPAATGEA